MENDELPIIIGDGTSEMLELGVFLDEVACSVAGETYYSREEREEAFLKSPIFGPYVRQGMRKRISNRNPPIELDFPSPTRLLVQGGHHLGKAFLREFAIGGIEGFWGLVSTGIAMGCAAGGTKAFIELLKTWVEERKGRRIKIKQGDVELEIQGGMSKKEVEEIVRLFEAKFTKSRIVEL